MSKMHFGKFHKSVIFSFDAYQSLSSIYIFDVRIIVLVLQEASVVQWLCHSPCKAGVAGSIPGFSSLSDGTINRGPVSI